MKEVTLSESRRRCWDQVSPCAAVAHAKLTFNGIQLACPGKRSCTWPAVLCALGTLHELCYNGEAKDWASPVLGKLQWVIGAYRARNVTHKIETVLHACMHQSPVKASAPFATMRVRTG